MYIWNRQYVLLLGQTAEASLLNFSQEDETLASIRENFALQICYQGCVCSRTLVAN